MTHTDDTDVPDYAGLLRLDGRRFVVLGAGQGIGRQTTHALASVGAKVFCVDQDPELAQEVAKEVDGIAATGDITNAAEVDRLFTEASDQMGGVDGVVDIVGMAEYGPLSDLTEDRWDWQFDIVLRHAYLALQYGSREMLKSGGGTMVFITSASAITGAPLHAAYGAAKAGLVSLVKSATLELGPKGIRVNAVAPGVVFTPRVSSYLGEEGRAANGANAPLGRVALPADIAAAILFFSSDLSDYVSGQILSVDGGVKANFPYPMPEVATSTVND